MSVSVLEALQNAEHNAKSGCPIMIWEKQLHNGIVLLEKGYSPYEQVEPLLEKYGSVENVPDKD